MLDPLLKRIIEDTSVFYKHQQLGQDEMTDVEKFDFLSQLFVKNKILFLQRYEKYITCEDCDLFVDDTKNSVRDFIIARIQQQANVSKRTVHNRRYMALEKLRSEGMFFSFEKMRERQPFLFEAMVGNFLTNEERTELCSSKAKNAPNKGWADVLSQVEESNEITQRKKHQQAKWNEQCGVSAESGRRCYRLEDHVSSRFRIEEDAMLGTSDGEEESTSMNDLKEEIEKIDEDEENSFEDVDFDDGDSPNTKRRDFIKLMEERFLDGKEHRFFDYGMIDNDYQLDDGDSIRDREMEEKWFDEEE